LTLPKLRPGSARTLMGTGLPFERHRRAGILGDGPNARAAVGSQLDPLGKDAGLGILQRREARKGDEDEQDGEARGAANGHLGIPPVEATCASCKYHGIRRRRS